MNVLILNFFKLVIILKCLLTKSQESAPILMRKMVRLIQGMRDLTVIEGIILEGQRKRREIRSIQRKRSIRKTREVDLTQKINVGHLNLKGVLF